jgi:hypothetical protein
MRVLAWRGEELGTPSALERRVPTPDAPPAPAPTLLWVVEFFLERDAAEAMIDEVRADEPALAGDLRIEAIEL